MGWRNEEVGVKKQEEREKHNHQLQHLENT